MKVCGEPIFWSCIQAIPWLASLVLLYNVNGIIGFFERRMNRVGCNHRWDPVQRSARIKMYKVGEGRLGFKRTYVFSTVCERCSKVKKWTVEDQK